MLTCDSDSKKGFAGVHSFHGYPMVVRTGGMLNAFFLKNAQPLVHPDTKDITLTCEGFK